MLVLSASQNAWGREDFTEVLKRELLALGTDGLSLQRHATRGGMPDEASLAVSVQHIQRRGNCCHIRAMVFFDEIVGGCSCHDDPEAFPACAHIDLQLDLQNGVTELRAATD